MGPELDYVDLGGGATTIPATNILTFMRTAKNDKFKIPIGYVVISDKFSGQGKN